MRGRAKLPTPMGGCLPQRRKGRARARQVAYPNRAMHATAALDLDAFLLRGSKPRCHERLSCWEHIRIGVFPYRPSPGHRRGPKCVWVSLFSEGPARGWSKMRLSSTDLAGSRQIRADSDAFWTRRPERPRIRPRLRRISDHRATGHPGHCPGRPRTPGRRAAGRSNAPADSVEVPHCASA